MMTQGSLNYLGNFDTREYKRVFDAIVVKSEGFDRICVDLRMRLHVQFHK